MWKTILYRLSLILRMCVFTDATLPPYSLQTDASTLWDDSEDEIVE